VSRDRRDVFGAVRVSEAGAAVRDQANAHPVDTLEDLRHEMWPDLFAR